MSTRSEELLISAVLALSVLWFVFDTVRAGRGRMRYRDLDRMLKGAGVCPSANVRAALETQWRGRGGTCAAFGLSFYVLVLLVVSLFLRGAASGFDQILLLPSLFTGLSVGAAVASLRIIRAQRGVVAISSLQPRSLSQYLPRREIAAQMILAFLGAVGIVLACLLAFGLIPISTDSNAVPSLLLVGIVLLAVSGGSLILERALTMAPVRGSHPEQLVIADVNLAIGLLDLVRASLGSAVMAFLELTFVDHRAAWVVDFYLVPALIAVVLLIATHTSARRVPVGQNLTMEARSMLA